jgi:hypothetical protein
VDPVEMSLLIGETGELTAEIAVRPDTAANKKVTWKSDDTDVATVDSEGTVTAVAVGTTTITATSVKDRTKKATCVITVAALKIDVVDGADGVTSIVTPEAGQVIRANIILSDGTPIYTYPVDNRVTYEWYYGESTDTILGTEGSYTVTSDNVGKTICVRVNVEGIGEATWEASGVVGNLTISRIDVVDGADGVTSIVTPKAGQVIRANIILSDGTPIYTYPLDERVTYEWYYGESTDTILGREGSYTVTTDNVGKTICVRVSVEGIGEATWEALGKVVVVDRIDVVDGADGVTSIVTPKAGQVIRANIILSDGTPIYTYPLDERVTYEWYYGESTDTILGREGSYTVTTDNVGKTICVRVNVEGIGEATWNADDVVAVSTDAYDAIVALVPTDNDSGVYSDLSWTAFQSAIGNCDLTLTAEAGQAALNAEVEKIQEALDLLVKVEEITAEVVVTAPVLGCAPEGHETIDSATDNPNFSVSNVAWIGDLTPDEKFKAECVYSAQIELTAAAGKMFAVGSFEARVGDATISDVEISSIGEGNKVTFTATFAATGDLEVSGIAVKTQPELKYFENAENIEKTAVQNTLNLSKLVATLIYNDGTTKDVPYSEFEDDGIGTSLEDGQVLTVDEHDGQTVGLTCNGYTTNTSKLDVTIGVEEIIVTSKDNKTTIVKSERFYMFSSASPWNVTNKSVTWTIKESTTAVWINATTGELARSASATPPPQVTVQATANDGSRTVGTMVITCPN